jgi:hypothetical protein
MENIKNGEFGSIYNPNKTFKMDIFDGERSILPPEKEIGGYFDFFSKININYISYQITQRLEGVHPEKKHIIVPDETIISVMDSIYNSTYRDVDKLTMMTIMYIVDYIKSEYQIEQQNNRLNIWVTQYTPETGLKRVPEIKLRHKRPTPMQFNMNY